MLKAELHTHTCDDPHDVIPYDAYALIDRAAELEYQVVAITLHDRQFDVTCLQEYGRRLGVAVIPGVERTICGKHVLLLNFPAAAERVTSFDELKRFKADHAGLVIAPHAFFPAPTCLGRYLERYAELFDAVEVSGFYTRHIDFNRRARRWAEAHGKPLVGNGDVHRLSQLGTTYSLIDAAPEADAICEAIRAGRVEVRTRPLSTAHVGALLASLIARVDVVRDSPVVAHALVNHRILAARR